MTHFFVSGMRFHWIWTHTTKDEARIAIKHFITFAIRFWKLPIVAFHSDNEKSVTMEFEENHMRAQGFVLTHSPEYHPEMNGPAERSGGVIITLARRLRVESGLPMSLWTEFVGAAVWILNRMPTHLKDEKRWIVPWEEIRAHFGEENLKKTDLSGLRAYGSLTYIRVPTNMGGQNKLKPRAMIGFLVGFVASNAWRVWLPQKGVVMVARDAVFDESQRWRPDMEYWKEHPLPIPEAELVPMQEAIDLINHEIGLNATQPSHREVVDEDEGEPEVNEAEIEIQPTGDRAPTQKEAAEGLLSPSPSNIQSDTSNLPLEPPSDRAVSEQLYLSPHPTEHSPTVRFASAEPERVDQPENTSAQSDTTAWEFEQLHQSQDERLSQAPLVSHRPRDDGVDSSNIVEGSRQRRSTQRDDYAYSVNIQSEISPLDIEPEHPAMLCAFAAALKGEKPTRQHHDDLPLAPDTWNDMLKHPHRDAFLTAAAIEVKGLERKETFEIVPKSNDRSIQVLPLRWVFTYKFDEDGYLIKHKARICVRGDLEWVTSEEKRAATLAARTARMLFALVAAFDFDMRQLDAVNAFLNSRLPKPVYTYMPQGFGRPGMCWKLIKALYGLRSSPKLWLQEASSVLTKLGLTPLPEDPCVFIGQGIIIFFYVDDILIANHPSQRDRAAVIERQLHEHWELTSHGDAKWFLGIRIIRDRNLKKLWLCQDAYITSMAVKYNLTNRAAVATPFSSGDDLQPFSGTAKQGDIDQFASKVGSAQYSTSITRVDAAKATAKLAQFMTNPSPQHLSAIDRVIIYLYHSRFLAIEYGIGSSLDPCECASDASFADNPGRKSSSGYLYQVFGGPVDWRASKQLTVTTSTTEAELLALSDAARSAQYWDRLMKHLGFKSDIPVVIQCDNKQTVDLVLNANTKLHTKLRHIDIHNHWLRQEVESGRVNIKWVPTGRMAADGLTKPLPRQKYEIFIKMLGMRDIEAYIDDWTATHVRFSVQTRYHDDLRTLRGCVGDVGVGGSEFDYVTRNV
jgi:hypothetical protein